LFVHQGRWSNVLIFLVVVLGLVLPRAFDLDRFVTTDEGLWIVRSANFYYALGQRDFSATYLSEHPGVVTMWAGTAGFLWRFPALRGVGLAGELDVFQYEKILSEHDHIHPEEILAAGRLIMVLIHTILLGLSFVYAMRLLGRGPAFLGFLLIAFDPFHIAHTRLLHLDGLLTSTMLLSILAFLSYIHRRRRFDLLVSGLAAGLS